MNDMHYYRKNIFGDVVGIYDAAGEKEAEYVYDAWGNCRVYDESVPVAISGHSSFYGIL